MPCRSFSSPMEASGPDQTTGRSLRPLPALRAWRGMCRWGIPPVPPGKAPTNKLVIEDSPIGQNYAGHGPPVAVFPSWIDRDDLSERQLRGGELGPAPEVLFRLRAVDSGQANLDRGTVLQDRDRAPSCTPMTLPVKKAAAALVCLSSVMKRELLQG